MTKRVAVVTGGASGIGLAVAQRLTAAGHSVGLLDVDGPALSSAVETLSKGGAKARAYEVDVSDRAALERVRGGASDLRAIGIPVTSAGIESFDLLSDITAAPRIKHCCRCPVLLLAPTSGR